VSKDSEREVKPGCCSLWVCYEADALLQVRKTLRAESLWVGSRRGAETQFRRANCGSHLTHRWREMDSNHRSPVAIGQVRTPAGYMRAGWMRCWRALPIPISAPASYRGWARPWFRSLVRTYGGDARPDCADVGAAGTAFDTSLLRVRPLRLCPPRPQSRRLCRQRVDESDGEIEPLPQSLFVAPNLNFAGASRSNDRLPALADDLVRRRVTVIAATSTPWPWRERRRRRRFRSDFHLAACAGAHRVQSPCAAWAHCRNVMV
jgi:hypothetical protein